MILVGVCTEFVFGFVLGKLLDFLGKLAEDLAKSNENQIRSGKVLGGRDMPKHAEKHAQSRPGKSKNYPKIFENRGLTPPKSMAKRS